MAKSIYHLACWKLIETASSAKGIPAKWRGRCASCLGAIERGETITWPRTGKNATPQGPTTGPFAEPTPAVVEHYTYETPNTSPEVTLMPATETAPASPDVNAFAAGLAAMVMPAVEQRIKCAMASFDGASDAIVSRAVAQVRAELHSATRVEYVAPSGEVVDAGIQHKSFPLLLKALAAGTNVWLAGPSGSGKTTAAIAAAKCMSLDFKYTGAVSDPYALMGYKDVHGTYVRTLFRDAYEHGGVFLWDEVDASDTAALLAFNAALANGHAAFPDGIVKRHADCRIIAAGNTAGHGATHEYVGRAKIDVAFLKRFSFIDWQYDEELETATAPNPKWTARVQEIRRKVASRGLRVLVTPRESYIGAALLAQGIAQSDVENMTVRSGMTEEQWSQVSR